ncbi:MAG: hypothetical protein QOE93_915 [Actinomycetota bacterium]|jgi:hypothetical protein|nr:hypothetical protein [Actinomycetota bacterium]
MGDVRRALADDHPLGLLALASSLLTVVDPRQRNPFERNPDPEDEPLTRDDLVASFIGVDRSETSALLAVIAEMAGDDVLRARIRRELIGRTGSPPTWATRLDEIDPYRAVEMVHVLGDGDDVMVGVRLPEGRELTVLVYIDHNVGTLVKDAFIVPGPIAELVEFMRAKSDNPDTEWRDLDLADARSRIVEAIDVAAITFPPFESDTWPVCRPLVEWVARHLPEGGRGYERPEWDDAALDAVTCRFFASPFGAALDDGDHRGLLESILWFASGYGPGDPLRWSPVAVEILLADWIPRKIVADARYLSKAPRLLRAFIRFCHDERGIRPALTEETLDAVDEWEPDYQRTIRSPRLQGPEALLAAVGALDPGDPWLLEDEEPASFQEYMLDSLRSAVGGEDALIALDAEPLPDEAFAWDGIPADVHERVTEVLGLVDRCCESMLDVECRTACRRFLARAASGDPGVFRRKARSDTTAAAVVWIVGKANDLFSQGAGGLLVKDLMAHFGLHQGGVSQRATSLLKAGGFPTDHYLGMDLGSAALLVGSRRSQIIARRERFLAMDGV